MASARPCGRRCPRTAGDRARDPADRAARPLRHARRAGAPARGGRVHRRGDRRAHRGGGARPAPLAGRRLSSVTARGAGPARHPARRARAVRVALARGRRRAGRRRAARPGRARAESRASSSPPTSSSRSPPPAVRLARRRQARQRARRARRRRRGPRAAWTSAPRPAASRTACCSAARARVIALDVAYGELHWRLRDDPRVTVIERANARALEPDALPYRAGPDRGRRLVHLADARCCRPCSRCAAPRVRLPGDGQAAVRGRARAGRQGRRGARPGAAARGASRAWRRAARRSAARCWASRRPGCPGPAGNLETFVWLAEGGRAGALDDVDGGGRGGGA